MSFVYISTHIHQVFVDLVDASCILCCVFGCLCTWYHHFFVTVCVSESSGESLREHRVQSIHLQKRSALEGLEHLLGNEKCD